MDVYSHTPPPPEFTPVQWELHSLSLLSWWLEQVLREHNHSLLEIFMSPSLLLVAYIFLVILLHNVCFYLHLSLLWCPEKSTGKTAKIGLRIRLFASERALGFLIVLQLKKGQFLYNKCQVLSYLIFKKWGGGGNICTGHPPPKKLGYISPSPRDLRQCTR